MLVGTSTGPSDVEQHAQEYGRPINTTWGELAFQLGGEDAFQMIADHDAEGIALIQFAWSIFKNAHPASSSSMNGWLSTSNL